MLKMHCKSGPAAAASLGSSTACNTLNHCSSKSIRARSGLPRLWLKKPGDCVNGNIITLSCRLGMYGAGAMGDKAWPPVQI